MDHIPPPLDQDFAKRRSFPSEGRGREFESRRVRHNLLIDLGF